MKPRQEGLVKQRKSTTVERRHESGLRGEFPFSSDSVKKRSLSVSPLVISGDRQCSPAESAQSGKHIRRQFALADMRTWSYQL